MASELSDIPHNMRRLYRRFERLRSAHTGRLPFASVALEVPVSAVATVTKIKASITFSIFRIIRPFLVNLPQNQCAVALPPRWV